MDLNSAMPSKKRPFTDNASENIGVIADLPGLKKPRRSKDLAAGALTKDDDDDKSANNGNKSDADDTCGPFISYLSPYYRLRYIDRLDPDASPSQRKLLHLLLKREQKPPRYTDAYESLSSQITIYSGHQTFNRYWLEILRVIMEESDSPETRLMVRSKFPVLARNWKFSRPEESLNGDCSIRNRPPLIMRTPIESTSKAKEYYRAIDGLYNELRHLERYEPDVRSLASDEKNSNRNDDERSVKMSQTGQLEETEHTEKSVRDGQTSLGTKDGRFVLKSKLLQEKPSVALTKFDSDHFSHYVGALRAFIREARVASRLVDIDDYAQEAGRALGYCEKSVQKALQVYSDLHADNDRLRAEKDGMKVERDELQSKLEGAQAEKDALKAEKAELKAKNDGLQAEKNNILTGYIELREKAKKLGRMAELLQS
jgi:hypothetical protein